MIRTGRDSFTSGKLDEPRGWIQHKREAWWFYRFLSLVYDRIVNPLHWTTQMRDKALSVARLDAPELVTVDVGGGTGFTTEGIIRAGIRPECITLLDQSPHQLARARRKTGLRGVMIIEGDAEELPFPTDHADRYVSAGSIEYWPEPQRGIAEAYRILKPGGRATIIGPIHPTNPLSRLISSAWMLFPSEEDYGRWFTAAGFKDLQFERICPEHYHGVREHGLIMGIAISGSKPAPGSSPLQLGPMVESRSRPRSVLQSILLPVRFVLGSAAAFYYLLLPFLIMTGIIGRRRRANGLR